MIVQSVVITTYEYDHKGQVTKETVSSSAYESEDGTTFTLIDPLFATKPPWNLNG